MSSGLTADKRWQQITVWAPWLVLVLAIIVALLRALPHLHEPLWQDEAATLFFHVTDWPWQSLSRYSSANSHMGFTAMLSAWISAHPGSMEVGALRMLPLALSLTAVPLVFLAGRRMDMAWTGAVAALLLAHSAVTENFATQLRGYGPSWPFLTLALLAALNVSNDRWRIQWRSTYALATLVAVSILPTNLFFAMAIAACVALRDLSIGPRDKKQLAGVAVLILVPPLCLIVSYAAVFPELLRYGQIAFSNWSRWDLLVNWIRGTLGDERLIIPLAMAGLFAQVALSAAGRSRAPGSFRLPTIPLPAALLIALPIALFAIPNPPFPRTLTPYLPIWYIAIAAALVSAIRALVTGAARRAALVGLVTGVVALMAGGPIAACRGAQGEGMYEYDLCYQYFRDGYDPRQVVAVWDALGEPDRVIVSNYEGYLAIGMLGSAAEVTHVTSFKPDGRLAPLVVAFDDAEARKLLGTMRSRVPYGLVADTGYFNVYAPVR